MVLLKVDFIFALGPYLQLLGLQNTIGKGMIILIMTVNIKAFVRTQKSLCLGEQKMKSMDKAIPGLHLMEITTREYMNVGHLHQTWKEFPWKMLTVISPTEHIHLKGLKAIGDASYHQNTRKYLIKSMIVHFTSTKWRTDTCLITTKSLEMKKEWNLFIDH